MVFFNKKNIFFIFKRCSVYFKRIVFSKKKSPYLLSKHVSYHRVTPLLEPIFVNITVSSNFM